MTYTTVGLLGRGGTAVVELAVDAEGRHVARKRVAISGSADQIAAARLRMQREARVLATLRHPAIVPLVEVDDDGDDLVLVLPYLPGGTLADRAPLPPEVVERLADRLLSGLACAHRQGIVHRDIKPANILFDADGNAAIADFGVASVFDATDGLTVTGTTIGTPGFMAPEQARGEAATPAADVFALGATLAFALTGEGPYGSGPPATLMWRASRGRVNALPRSIPRPLRKRLAAMLDPNPAKRPTASGTTPIQAARPRNWAVFCTELVVAALIGGTIAYFATTHTASARAAKPAPAAAIPCTPLPYQPCGQPLAAPFTDGRQCVEGHADYDGDATNGCEAVADTVDGTALTEHEPIRANLVPADDVDNYPIHVTDRFQFLCDGELQVRLIAPAGATDRLEILRNGKVVARAVSSDGEPATAAVRDPDCFHDDSGTLVARISAVDSHTASDYRLDRSGSF